MKQVISAIERAIRIEEAKIEKKTMMLANKNVVLYDEPLPITNSEYLKELKKVLPLLKYLVTPLHDWTKIINGNIEIPDEIYPLANKIDLQIKLHTISGKSEAETVCHITFLAQIFFHQLFNN